MNDCNLRHVAAVVLCAVVLPCRAATQTTSAPAPSTSPSIVKDSRTFELRTYYATPGKLEELHQRFRNQTIRLFKKHGMTIVGFWAPTAPADAAANTLVYVLAIPAMRRARRHGRRSTRIRSGLPRATHQNATARSSRRSSR